MIPLNMPDVLKPSTAGGPLPPGERYEIVDIVRGFALLGVFVANMIWTSRWFALTDAQRAALPTAEVDRFVNLAAVVFIDYKFYTLFSMLFGMGFAMQLRRSSRPEVEIVRTHVRRMLLLLVIGACHGLLLWFGDILHIYALLGLVLIPFRKRSDRVLIVWIVVLAVLVTLFPLLQGIPNGASAAPETADSVEQARFAAMQGTWSEIVRLNWEFNREDYTQPSIEFDSLPYWYLSVFWKFLLGFVIGRRMLLQRAEEHLGLYRRALPPLLTVGLIGNVSLGVGSWLLGGWWPEYPSLWTKLVWIPIDLSMLALSLAYIAGLVLLFQHPRFKAGLRFLAPVGRMALTNYLSQSVAMVLLLYGVGLGLLGKAGAAVSVCLCLAVYALQVAASNWWLKRFRFGPAEWAWRSLTYGRLQTMMSKVDR